MLTEDYIMRMISQALAVLMTALGLKRAGQYSQALNSLDQAIESLLGVNPRLVEQLEDSLVLDMVTFVGKLDIERVNLLADILREKADIYAIIGDNNNSQAAARRSLRFFLEAMLAREVNPVPELIQRVEEMRKKVTPTSLSVETRLALLDYLERLLSLEDDVLASHQLSRLDLLAAHSTIHQLGVDR